VTHVCVTGMYACAPDVTPM